MLKIGIADYYLDNWHANYYPGFLREAAKKFGFDADIVSAFAFCDRPGGVSTDDWCAERSIRRASSMEEMLREADAVMVIAADIRAPVGTNPSPSQAATERDVPSTSCWGTSGLSIPVTGWARTPCSATRPVPCG